MVGRAAGFHDDQRYIAIREPAFELAACQSMRLDDMPLAIGHGELEDVLGKIDGHGSSIHFGLLSLETDPRPHEHRWRLFSAKTTGESIPSFERDAPR